MHIYFSGIGGAGIGPLAQIAHQAGYEVSGSDQQDSQYIDYLKKHGITNIHIGQDRQDLEKLHNQTPIDWLVHSSAVKADHPELVYAREAGIKTSKRDELLNQILQDKNLKLIAVAGTHGKTTTTAMAIWLFKRLGIPVSYSVGAKLPFGDMGQYDPDSEYFVYEADEFDRNFLAFHPTVSLIAGVSWDHHEIFPTREDYKRAFRDFLANSQHVVIWSEDQEYLDFEIDPSADIVLDAAKKQSSVKSMPLRGEFNRRDARLALEALKIIGKPPADQPIINSFGLFSNFPGLSRRMEEIAPNLYSDYAHTPEKIRGAMSVATEMAKDSGQDLIVVYEPLTNRRQHYMRDDYKDVFSGAKHVYWIPSYLAREDPGQKVLSPAELISGLSDPSIATPMERNEKLHQIIQKHLDRGEMVVCMAGGGGDSLDDWLRSKFS